MTQTPMDTGLPGELVTANAPAAVALHGVVKTFRIPSGGEVRAVDGIDLTIRPGEVVALLGPNGAGKTTTLDLVLGLTRPSAGDVRILDQTAQAAVRTGRVSAVLQSGGLLRDLTVRETVEMIASTYPHPMPVEDVLDRAGITALAGRLVSKCSGGEQQRLRFAIALLPDPDLLILDEPTAGMDVVARRAFWDTMRADADAGRTVVFATHYLEEADAFARRIVLVAGGRVVADGPTAQVRARATGRTVCADLPSDSADAGVEMIRALDGVGDVRLDGTRVTVQAGDSDAVARLLLSDLGARDLEITTGSLETAFLALTGASR